jgi:tetratricopeptide (TPR) repeat protein
MINRNAILASGAAVSAFIAITLLFLFVFSHVGVELSTSSILSLVAGFFVTYMVVISGQRITEFSIKSGIIGFTAKLDQSIKEVKKDMIESKKDTDDKLSAINQNLQLQIQMINQNLQLQFQSIDNKLYTNLNTKMNQQVKFDFGEIGNALAFLYGSQIENMFTSKGIDVNRLKLTKELPEKDKNNLTPLVDKFKEVEMIREKSSVTSPPLDRKTTITYANALYYLGRYKEALKIYNNILEIYPNDIDALVNRGIVHYRLGDIQSAELSFDKALKIDKNNFDALLYKTLVLNRLGKREQAIEYYDSISKIPVGESNIDAMVNKGVAYEIMGKSEDAIEIYKVAIKAPSEESVDVIINQGIANNKLGVLLQNHKYHAEAMRYYDRACSWTIIMFLLFIAKPVVII